jgi:hypothetical protein
MATIYGPKLRPLWRTLGRSWYAGFYGERAGVLTAADDWEAK